MPWLRPAQRLDLADILKAAFMRPQMEMFLSDKFTKRIGDYTSPDDDDRTAMLNIVNRADEQEWLQDLLSHAIAERKKNGKLQQFDQMIKWLDELNSALLARFGTSDSFQVIMASINKNWSDYDSNRTYKDRLQTVIADAHSEGWLTKLIDKVIKESGEGTKRTLSDIKSRLVPASVSNLDVVFLGSALDDLAPKISALVDDCIALFQKHSIRALALKDHWMEEWPKQAELQPPRSTANLIAVHCVDVTTANSYALQEDLVARNIKQATGDEQTVRRHIVWLPDGSNAGAIAERIRTQKNGYQSAVHFLSGPADQLQLLVERWLGRTPKVPTGLTPAFMYQPIKSTRPQTPSGNIVEEVIIPKISPQLQDKFTPPEWEKILFSEEKEARKLIEDLTIYPFGIVAINNFNGDIDQEGKIPKDFQDRITTMEEIIQDQVKPDKLNSDNILRLGIIATTQPGEHLFQYSKARNAIIARWRFVAVRLEEDKEPQVVGGHLDLLCEELRSLLNRSAKGASH